MDNFELPGNRKEGASIDVAPVRGQWRSGDFQIALTACGFEAYRYLTVQDMEDLRDWIVLALAKQKETAA